MTVLMVSQPGEAGVAQVVADHVAWVSAAGAAALVACDPASRLADLVEAAGGSVLPWHATRGPGPSLAAEARTLSSIVARTDPDLVHLHSSKAGLAGRLVIRGRRPTIFQPHAWSFEAATGVLGQLTARWERHAARWTDVTVCVSAAEEAHGRRVGVPGPFVVLENTVDLQRFRPGDRGVARARLTAVLGPDADRPLAVCLGRLCEQKGQDLLLTAWPQVTSSVPGAQLALVGDGPDRERLRASSPEGVLFAGPTTDPVPWLQAADVVVVPSRWEGQALALLEALACGAAVVVSDIPANAETLPHGAGAAVRVDDPAALATAVAARMKPIGRSAAVAEGRAGRAHVTDHHDPATAARTLLGLYDRTLARRADSSSSAVS